MPLRRFGVPTLFTCPWLMRKANRVYPCHDVVRISISKMLSEVNNSKLSRVGARH